MPPDGSVSPMGSKMSRLAEHKIIGTENKNFAHHFLGVILKGTIPYLSLILGPVNIGYIKAHILDTYTQHVQPFGKPCPSPTR